MFEPQKVCKHYLIFLFWKNEQLTDLWKALLQTHRSSIDSCLFLPKATFTVVMVNIMTHSAQAQADIFCRVTEFR